MHIQYLNHAFAMGRFMNGGSGRHREDAERLLYTTTRLQANAAIIGSRDNWTSMIRMQFAVSCITRPAHVFYAGVPESYRYSHVLTCEWVSMIVIKIKKTCTPPTI